MTINGSTKFVGIGTTTPDTKLQVVGSTTTSDLIVTDNTTSNSLDVNEVTRTNDLIVAANTSTKILNVTTSTTTNNLNVTTSTTTSDLNVSGTTTTGSFTLTSNTPAIGDILKCTSINGDAEWFTAPESNPSPWLACGSDIHFSEGNVGIGTTNTHGYQLAVYGKILTEEVMVKHPVNWPDYVFHNNYKLTDLKELEKFVNQNHHLPEIPSEKEVSENGIELAKMNGLLLKKIEELTLYLIEQQKQLEMVQERLSELEN
jgi:hypothetical protein